VSEAEEFPDRTSTEHLDSLGPLPEAVRNRVITLVADALGRMAPEQLPPALKRVAAFATARRAKLAANQIASIVETDSAFRERVAVQVRAEFGDLAAAVESGSSPPAAEPVDLAAVAYLLRAPGWLMVVRAASDAAKAERSAVAEEQEAGRAERLRAQLDTANEEIRSLRQRHREQLAALKGDNSDLRRKLGESRTRLKSSESLLEQSIGRAEEAEASARSAAASSEAEVRRLRARIDELERDVAQTRRDDRTARDRGALRARLLLDTLLESVQGLRRELALPPVEGLPADAVEAHLAEEGSSVSAGHGSLRGNDPALLDELLGLPRVHLIVDGYNVTKNAWPTLSLEKQRDRLLTGLAPIVARSGAEITVVFDAAELRDRPPVVRPRGVRVLFSPHGVIADDVIRELVDAEPQGRPVVVVTSDQAVATDVVRSGAKIAGAPALSALLGRT
jgi:predicted RNA-binding protein with PIN domain